MELKTTGKHLRINLLYTGIFAAAMAYLESAVVVYLRRVYGIAEPTALSGYDPQISVIEVGRELATLVMLVTVGLAAGKNLLSRCGFALYAFGLWDIFYYAWLRVFTGWPASLLDRDLLFLIPLPWWGPVLAPALIALLMALCGGRAVLLAEKGMTLRVKPLDWITLAAGSLIMLYTFMADSLAILPADAAALSAVRPAEFNWMLYLAGLALAAFAVWRVTRRGLPRSR